MKTSRKRLILAIVLIAGMIGGTTMVVWPGLGVGHRVHLTAYFDNTNGIFPGDDVMILGVPVGRIDTIEPQPQRAKVTFWVDHEYQVPADAMAAIISPQLITSRAIQLTPAYTSGPALDDGGVIPQNRTAVPVEWDDFRVQLEKLSDSLQPTDADGVSPLGSFINTAADNLRGQGADIRAALIRLSQAVSALADHSGDLFSSVRNLSLLVSALNASADLMRELNYNLAAVTSLFANDGTEIGDMFAAVDTVTGDLRNFLADNKEAIGTSADKLASISQMMVDNIDDIKQALHVAPNTFQNFVNIYEPAHAATSGIMTLNNFSNPIEFLCGAIQAASRLGADQAAKLCVQYLAPIVKNRQYNFLPFGLNLGVNAQARPNEVTYSEDWMRPDYVPAPTSDSQPPTPGNAKDAPQPPPTPPGVPLAAEAPAQTNPADGLPGLMVPGGRP